MTKTFDPHYHTIQSDGMDKIMDSSDVAYQRGFAMLIITDHLSANKNWIGSTKSYKRNQEIIKLFRPKPRNDHYPIIVGIELYLPPKVGEGEVLIFGTELCEVIQNNLEEISEYDLVSFLQLKEKYECAIVQCHPMQGLQYEILPILDGCEITRKGIAVSNYEHLINDCNTNGITPLTSSDGHTHIKQRDIPWLGKAHNIASIEMRNEKDLIRVIKENLIEKMSFSKEEIERDFFRPF